MIRVRRHVLAHRRMAGLSLIEMMIALVMALIVAAGIITVFQSTSSSNRVQSQLATLQEEGRFAIHSLRTDLANANGTYCSNSGGNASATGSGRYLDSLRSPTIYAKDFPTINAAFHDNTEPLVAPGTPQAFSLPSRIFMRGYDCGTTSASCQPVDPSTGVLQIPAMGTVAGDRVPGAAVLTIRYLKPNSGWAISATGNPPDSTISANSDGTVDTITLRQGTGEEPISNFTGSLAMLADCSNAQVFSVSNSSGVLTPNNNYAAPLDISKGAAPRVFDFDNDFQTVTYYLKVVDVGNGQTTGELVRQVNGIAQPLVRGVERLDFRYGIIDGDGTTEFLTAAEVDSATTAGGASISCPPGVGTDGGMGNAGCLWRAVQTIEVHILMDGQTPLYTLTPQEMAYIYSPDQSVAPVTPEKASLHTIKPDADQGFPLQLLRREFTTVVALRNFNP
ncbi:MAG TPA: PilW family protein [Rhodanobacteraceae bacterium]|nr:PilW family protein [Rhodanobacteraceae bacterium]